MADFACHITIDNQTKWRLTGMKSNDAWGHYSSAPPPFINAGAAVSFDLADNAGASSGSQGWVKYDVQDASGQDGTIKFSYSCPFTEDNTASIKWESETGNPPATLSFEAKTGDGDYKSGEIDKSGHPVYVTFTVHSTAD